MSGGATPVEPSGGGWRPARVLVLLLAALPLCPPTGDALVVEFGAHRLSLCQGGEAKRQVRVTIGLHGPPRDTKDEGDANVSVDWIWGCVALASDVLVDEVAAFVRERKVTRVEFRE